MSQVPEWMKQVAEFGRELRNKQELEQRTRLASTSRQTYEPQSGWSENRVIQRATLHNHVKASHEKSLIGALKADSINELSRALRQQPHHISQIEFGDSITAGVTLYSKDRKRAVTAQFSFSLIAPNKTKLANTFASNDRMFPVSEEGLRHALASATDNPHGTKLITRAQIASRLATNNPEVIDSSIREMINAQELKELDRTTYAYRALPKKLASLPLQNPNLDEEQTPRGSREVPSVTPLTNEEMDKKKELSKERPDQAKQENSNSQETYKSPAQNRPLPPKAPGETDQQLQNRTSGRLGRVLASFMDQENCREGFVNEIPPHLEFEQDMSAQHQHICPTCQQPVCEPVCEMYEQEEEDYSPYESEIDQMNLMQPAPLAMGLASTISKIKNSYATDKEWSSANEPRLIGVNKKKQQEFLDEQKKKWEKENLPEKKQWNSADEPRLSGASKKKQEEFLKGQKEKWEKENQ